MNNKKLLLFVFVLGLSCSIFGQNPNNTPCVAGDAFFDAEFENSLTDMVFTSESMARSLPSSVDNSTSRFMPPIFNQWGSSSCVHCAEIGYVLTYELNRYRGVDAGSNWTGTESQRENLYHPFFTYNFVNNGDGRSPTGFGSGFKIVCENGCPSLNDYYDPVLNQHFNPGSSNASQWAFRRWMDGEEKYINASENKTRVFPNNMECYKITWGNTYETLTPLKRWLHNHNSSSNTGGIAVISVCMGSDSSGFPLFDWDTIQTGPGAGEKILTSWAPTGWHALTIVGYNDDICLSGDCSNPNPNTPLSDCEKGAFKVANSWGNNYTTTNGYIWVPYSLMANINKRAYTCVFEEEPEKLLFLSATIKHPKRNKIIIYVGRGDDALSSSPIPNQGDSQSFHIFKNSGGPFPMNGNDDNPQPIGLSLNFGEKFDPDNCGKYFFQIKDNSPQSYSANQAFIENYYLTDFRWNEKFVLNSSNAGEPIQNNTMTTLAINYHLLPFDEAIVSSFTMETDRVARRTITVNSGTFTINNGVKLDMYGTDDFDCNLVLSSGTNLVIGDNAIITAKRGNCLIDISGEIQIGDNVRFVAENGATLLVRVNHGRILHLDNCSFENASLLVEATKGLKESLNSSYIPEISVENCRFTASYGESEFAIKVYGYIDVLIKDNIICGLDGHNIKHYADGIIIHNSGNLANNSRVYGNSISGCIGNGLALYAGRVDVLRNRITKCGNGVCVMNNSTVNHFDGNCAALNANQTQYIHDNDNNEVVFCRGSVPREFRFNYITNSTENVPFVCYDNNYSRGLLIRLDLEYNNWGNLSNSAIENHFSAVNMGTCGVCFDYSPQWNLGACLDDYEEASLMEREGDSLWGAGAFASAKQTYKNIIELYPASFNSSNAMKKLFLVECASGQDFSSLQEYYGTNNVILGDENMIKLSSVLSNKCNEEMKKYDEVIAWYENVISDTSTSHNDSICATIDLGGVYLTIAEEGGKAMGKLKEFVPQSAEAYSKQTNLALHQLRFNGIKLISEKDEQGIGGRDDVFNLYPNPTKDVVKIIGESIESLEIVNLTGQQIIQKQLHGLEEIYLNLEGLSPGVYFVRVSDSDGGCYVKKLVKE